MCTTKEAARDEESGFKKKFFKYILKVFLQLGWFPFFPFPSYTLFINFVESSLWIGFSPSKKIFILLFFIIFII